MNRDSATPAPGVLIVDDHAISRRYIAAALRQTNWCVKQAATASKALSIALSWLPQLILLDVKLGPGNGFDLARHIWEKWPDSLQRPRMVVLSADLPDPHQMKLSSHCVHGFLLKPVSAARLLAVVEPGRHHPVSTDSPGERLPELQRLFRLELAAQLTSLDRYLTIQDLPAAGEILHQLIASSGLCREPRLESALRGLEEACRKSAGAAELGQRYFSLLVNARDYLALARSSGS